MAGASQGRDPLQRRASNDRGGGLLQGIVAGNGRVPHLDTLSFSEHPRAAHQRGPPDKVLARVDCRLALDVLPGEVRSALGPTNDGTLTPKTVGSVDLMSMRHREITLHIADLPAVLTFRY